jgi:hypothetical protein
MNETSNARNRKQNLADLKKLNSAPPPIRKAGTPPAVKKEPTVISIHSAGERNYVPIKGSASLTKFEFALKKPLVTHPEEQLHVEWVRKGSEITVLMSVVPAK